MSIRNATAGSITHRGPGRPSAYTEALAGRIAGLYAEGRSWREIAAIPGMPARSTVEEWYERHEGFRAIIARARRSKADEAAHEAGRLLAECDVDREPHRTASARVQLATSRSNYLRWLAACLDRETYGDRTGIDVKGQLVVVTAFLDMAPRPVIDASATVLRTLPKVQAPDVTVDGYATD